MKTKTKKTAKRASGSLDPVVGQRNSAYLNLNTATYDIEDAKAAWRSGDDKECVRVISDLMRQLESAKAKLKSKTTSNRPAQRRLRVQRIVSQQPKVFSGDNSARLWDAINATNKPNNDIWSALYLLGYHCQELEAKLDKLANGADQPQPPKT